MAALLPFSIFLYTYVSYSTFAYVSVVLFMVRISSFLYLSENLTVHKKINKCSLNMLTPVLIL